jgi:pimeloyl-ACP methyl ester carboxylesterase
MGERKHLRHACEGLSTYIDDVCGVMELEGLKDIILVGHSFGGMCISGVADRLPAHIKRLVYLDACVPQNGQSLVTQGIANPPEDNAKLQAKLEGRNDNWLPPPTLDLLGLEGAAEWVRLRELACMTDFPVSAMTGLVEFVNGGPQARSTFIVCDNPPMPGTSFAAHYAKIVAGDYGTKWTARRIATGHMPMYTAFSETVALLAEAALMD